MLVTILTTIIRLWLASLVSDVLVEKLIHPKEKIPRHELGEVYRNSKGILHSSQMTIFVLILSMLGVMPIKSAINYHSRKFPIRRIYFARKHLSRSLVLG